MSAAETELPEIISVEDLRAKLGTAVRIAMNHGRVTYVTIHGVPMAKIMPVSSEERIELTARTAEPG